MATITTDSANYAAIAAAIRTKNGTQQTYTPAQMAAGISAIATGAKLRYRVVAATTRPESAQENTIWINSDLTPTSVCFQNEAPSAPESGAVWIMQGAQSHAPFVPAEGCDFKLYPVSVRQYSGTEWMDIAQAESYIGGAWRDWGVHLYDAGSEYEGFTGGWKIIAVAATLTEYGIMPTVTRADTLYTTATSKVNTSKKSGYTIYTGKLIDLSGVSSVNAEISETSGFIKLGLINEGETCLDTSLNVSCANTSTTVKSFSLDVSTIKGARKVGILATNNAPTLQQEMTLRLHRVWLE